jgi:ubiquinone/menaquinone biosynthesis C-methylase UbiE
MRRSRLVLFCVALLALCACLRFGATIRFELLDAGPVELPPNWRAWRMAEAARTTACVANSTQAHHRSNCILASLLAPLATEPAIEIGGPSRAYNGQPFHVYTHLSHCDNVRFSGNTLWEKNTGGVYHWVKGKPAGKQFYLDAANLSGIPTAAYSTVMSAHNLEHLANPLKALLEQKRILRPLGVLLLTLPFKEATFDHKRPSVTMAHLLEDLANGTDETDLSHLEEILKFHDLDRDPQAGKLHQFRKRSLSNFQNRGLHQHVFDGPVVQAMLEHAGFTVVSIEVYDFHLCTIAIRSETP